MKKKNRDVIGNVRVHTKIAKTDSALGMEAEATEKLLAVQSNACRARGVTRKPVPDVH